MVDEKSGQGNSPLKNGLEAFFLSGALGMLMMTIGLEIVDTQLLTNAPPVVGAVVSIISEILA